MSGEVIHVDFSINPREVENAARKLLALEEIKNDYDDENIIRLAEEDLSRVTKRLTPRESQELPRKAEEIRMMRQRSLDRYQQGLEE
jgi:hypothetical protein